MNDFRVEQTYDQIKELVENAAFGVLAPPRHSPEWSKAEDEWAYKLAKRIAGDVVMHLDAAEDT